MATSIIATIGPASNQPDTIKDMILSGMTMIRINFAHGTFAEHKDSINMVREIARSMGRHVPIMADLPSLKMRLGNVDGVVTLTAGQAYTLTTRDVNGNKDECNVRFDLTPCVKLGSIIYVADGMIQLKIRAISGDDIVCKVVVGGNISSRKGVNVPGADLKTDVFTDQDKKCLDFCSTMGVEFVCQSFVRHASDVASVRTYADKLGYNPIIIAKIETSDAVREIRDIIDVSDGVMVARGDLGIEVEIERIALIQKYILREASGAGKTAIIGTQLLSSMCGNVRPLRSEVTDITNAVLDGATHLMLSDETAAGKYPNKCIQVLNKVTNYANASEFIFN